MYRIGLGSDVHRLEEGLPLILGGVEIHSEIGAVGHSDADALFHAVTDAIFGALALGDIGSHFSDADQRWEGADSRVFIKEAIRLMSENGFTVENVDSIINLQRPKLRPYIDKMRDNLATEMNVGKDRVSIKAKTGEGLDAIGQCRSIKTEACILLRKV